MLLPGPSHSSLCRNTDSRPWLDDHLLFSQHKEHVIPNRKYRSSVQGWQAGSHRACCRRPLAPCSAGGLEAGCRAGAAGEGHSHSLTRDRIVSGPIGWFLIHPRPTHHDQITAGPRICFPVHLALGTVPGFRNTWEEEGTAVRQRKKLISAFPQDELLFHNLIELAALEIVN